MKTFDYELKLKPWQELVRLANFVDNKGLHYNNFIIDNKTYFTLANNIVYGYDIFCMGIIVYYNSKGKQINNSKMINIIDTLYDLKCGSNKEMICQSTFKTPLISFL